MIFLPMTRLTANGHNRVSCFYVLSSYFTDILFIGKNKNQKNSTSTNRDPSNRLILTQSPRHLAHIRENC